jgi:leucyl aminopeptidase
MWPMPIPEEMNERIRSSKVADLAQHDWIRWGGGLFAAAFLREFTDGCRGRTSTSPGRRSTPAAPGGHLRPPAAPASPVATLVEYVPRAPSGWSSLGPA